MSKEIVFQEFWTSLINEKKKGNYENLKYITERKNSRDKKVSKFYYKQITNVGIEFGPLTAKIEKTEFYIDLNFYSLNYAMLFNPLAIDKTKKELDTYFRNVMEKYREEIVKVLQDEKIPNDGTKIYEQKPGIYLRIATLNLTDKPVNIVNYLSNNETKNKLIEWSLRVLNKTNTILFR
ncbi:MAG: hypothetical protein GYA14_09080, partial [Ignavibacteria bacterium]|nr:hypothetical protein [Ignavibacteria bacterium]